MVTFKEEEALRVASYLTHKGYYVQNGIICMMYLKD